MCVFSLSSLLLFLSLRSNIYLRLNCFIIVHNSNCEEILHRSHVIHCSLLLFLNFDYYFFFNCLIYGLVLWCCVMNHEIWTVLVVQYNIEMIYHIYINAIWPFEIIKIEEDRWEFGALRDVMLAPSGIVVSRMCVCVYIIYFVRALVIFHWHFHIITQLYSLILSNLVMAFWDRVIVVDRLSVFIVSIMTYDLSPLCILCFLYRVLVDCRF